MTRSHTVFSIVTLSLLTASASAQTSNYSNAFSVADRAAAEAVATVMPELRGAELTLKLGIPRPLIVGVPEDGRTLVVIVGENRLKTGRDLRPGTYVVRIAEDGTPRITRDGAEFGFTAKPPTERFLYAIGNFDVEWMCEKAPEIIHDYCTTFVWCATADLFC